MASPLIFRIASTLDNRGFEDFKRQIGEFTSRIRSAQVQTVSLQGAFTDLGKIVASAFATNQFRQFVASAIEQERVISNLANRFTLLGESGDQAARSVARLTEAQSTQTRFSQTEQLTALNAILRTAKSSTEAMKELSLAQEIAAATGADLSTSALALSRAQAGSVFFLSRLTGITAAQVREFQRSGTLIDELSRRFRGFAERDAQTLGGQLDIIRNKFQNLGQSIGEDLVPVVKVFADALNAIPAPVLRTGVQLALLSASLGGIAAAGRAASGVLTILGRTTAGVVAGRQLVFPFIQAASAAGGLTAALRGLLTLVGGPGALLVAGLGALLLVLNNIKDGIDKDIASAEAFGDRFRGVAQALQLAAGETAAPFKNLEEASKGVANAIEQLETRLGQPIGASERQKLQERLQSLQSLRSTLDAGLDAERRAREIDVDEERKKQRELQLGRNVAAQTEIQLERLQLQQRKQARETFIQDISESETELQDQIRQATVELDRLQGQQEVQKRIAARGGLTGDTESAGDILLVESVRKAIEADRKKFESARTTAEEKLNRLRANASEEKDILERTATLDLQLQKLREEAALSRLERTAQASRATADLISSLQNVDSAELDKTEPFVLNRRLLTIRTTLEARRKAIDDELEAELQSIDIRARAEGLSQQEILVARKSAFQAAERDIASTLKDALQEAKPIEQALGDKRSVRSAVEEIERQLQGLEANIKAQVELELRLGDKAIDEVEKAATRALNRVGFVVEDTIRRKGTAPSGKR